MGTIDQDLEEILYSARKINDVVCDLRGYMEKDDKGALEAIENMALESVNILNAVEQIIRMHKKSESENVGNTRFNASEKDRIIREYEDEHGMSTQELVVPSTTHNETEEGENGDVAGIQKHNEIECKLHNWDSGSNEDGSMFLYCTRCGLSAETINKMRLADATRPVTSIELVELKDGNVKREYEAFAKLVAVNVRAYQKEVNGLKAGALAYQREISVLKNRLDDVRNSLGYSTDSDGNTQPAILSEREAHNKAMGDLMRAAQLKSEVSDRVEELYKKVTVKGISLIWNTETVRRYLRYCLEPIKDKAEEVESDNV